MRFSTTPLFFLPALAIASSDYTSTASSLSPAETDIPSPVWVPIGSHVVIAKETPQPNPDLRLREVVGNVGATTTAVSQAPTITVLTEYTTVNGVAEQVYVTYTQTFAAVPDQWSSAGVGSIGLGTIEGTVGVVKNTKRDAAPEPTAAAISEEIVVKRSDEVEKREANDAAPGNLGSAGASSVLALAIAVAACIAF